MYCVCYYFAGRKTKECFYQNAAQAWAFLTAYLGSRAWLEYEK